MCGAKGSPHTTSSPLLDERPTDSKRMKNMKKIQRQKLLASARKMPPLYHKLPGEPFDIRKSRVLWWLVKQPSVLHYLWNLFKDSGVIYFNRDTGKWQGVDFHHEED